ncbi:tetraspanihypothetical protein [Limosa lapponica baueri]|uniref:Tetraspanin n=1 Tax=Limosa lapponica baueri TaxID=1758121 RepID=A0A2I0TIF0_LIMLA|nr:tetraspanihypothetical protein [Limosa lapponica baueri]
MLCGCGLLGVGIWLSVSQGNFATFSPSFPSLSAANLVIAIGTVIMVTGFLGCLGAIKENKCLLLSVSESAKNDLKEGMKLYNSENNVGLKNAWNIIQAEMKCCGVNDFTDWYPVLGENTVPDRCCTENSQDCGRNSTELVWKTVRLTFGSLKMVKGCYERVMTWFDENKHVLGSIGMCILIMQVLHASGSNSVLCGLCVTFLSSYEISVTVRNVNVWDIETNSGVVVKKEVTILRAWPLPI